MLRKITYSLMVILFLTSFTVKAAEKWVIDEKHSYVLWKIGHLGFSSQSGKWYVNGFIFLDRENPQKSKVEVTIDLSKIITGIPELDNHLKGKAFFDIANYPKATFVSQKIEILSKTSAKISGILSLHGVSKPVVLRVNVNKIGKNPINDKMTAGFTARTELNRSAFDMKTLLPDLEDKVAIEIGVEAYQSNP